MISFSLCEDVKRPIWLFIVQRLFGYCSQALLMIILLMLSLFCISEIQEHYQLFWFSYYHQTTTSDMLSDNDDNGCQKVIDPRKILSPSKFGLVLDKFEIQRLIREESKRVSLKENEHGSSQAWDNFRIVVLDGVPLDFVCCNRCLAVYKYSSNAGTTGLNRHRKLCQGTST